MSNKLIVHQSSETEVSIPKGKSFLDSGIVGKIDWVEIFRNVSYNKPLPFWKMNNNAGILDEKKYLQYMSINKKQVSSYIEDAKAKLTQTDDHYQQTMSGLNDFEEAMLSLDFDKAKTIAGNIEKRHGEAVAKYLHWCLEYIADAAARSKTAYEATQEHFYDSNNRIDEGKLKAALPQDKRVESDRRLFLFMAQHIQELNHHDIDLIIKHLNDYVINKLLSGHFLYALQLLDQIDYFQLTYKDIGFRFSLNTASIPELFKPEIFREIDSADKQGFIDNTRKVYRSNPTLRQKLLQQIEQYYSGDDFFYRRVMSGERNYEPKQDYLDFLKQHSQTKDEVGKDLGKALNPGRSSRFGSIVNTLLGK